MDYQFKFNFEVRDYECDLQRIVNNAVYQHYLEHTRHVFLKHKGVDFSSLAENGINLVVIRVESIPCIRCEVETTFSWA